MDTPNRVREGSDSRPCQQICPGRTLIRKRGQLVWLINIAGKVKSAIRSPAVQATSADLPPFVGIGIHRLVLDVDLVRGILTFNALRSFFLTTSCCASSWRRSSCSDRRCRYCSQFSEIAEAADTKNEWGWVTNAAELDC